MMGDTVTGVERRADEQGFEVVFRETRHHCRLDNFLRLYAAQHASRRDEIFFEEVLKVMKEKYYWARHFDSKDFGFDTKPTNE